MKSPIHSHIDGRNIAPLQGFKAEQYQDLARIGINLPSHNVQKMAEYFAMDSVQGLTATTASIATPVQFLQNWLPGFVHVITAARKIDELIGISVVGNWADEEVVQGIKELTGTAVPYGDYTNIPLSSWNVNFEKRTNVRFEEGLKVGRLEEQRAAAMRVNSGEDKREAAAQALEIQRNLVGFYGYNDGQGRTYGLLNDPNLPAYVQVALNAGATSRFWSQKSALEIIADIRGAIASLRTNSQDTIDPKTVPLTLGVATDAVDYLTVTTEFGWSVLDWLRTNYPNIRVVSAPQFNNANAGDGVFYLYADAVSDGSTDDGRTFAQLVASKFQLVGVQQLAKGYEEDYSNATAGTLCKRPYAIVRRYGIS